MVGSKGRFFLRSLILVGLVLVSTLLTACSLAVNADRVQCKTKADCTSRGGLFSNAVCSNSVCQVDPTWACLATPAATSMQSAPYQISVGLRDLITQAPVSGAQVRLCHKIDVDCAAPVSTATSDGAGDVTFSVDAPTAAGYVTVQADGYVQTLYFFNPPIDHDQTIPPISLASPTANAGLIFQLGSQPVAGHGSIVVSSADCTGAPAASVSYSTPNGDGATTAFYTVGSLPETTATATDAGGYGGLINVPAGAATLTATLTSPHAVLGTISMLVRDGAITYSRVVPLGD